MSQIQKGRPIQQRDIGLQPEQDQKVEHGSGARQLAKGPVPSTASPKKLPVIRLLDRQVELGQKTTQIQSIQNEYTDTAKIKEVSKRVAKAADVYSNSIDEALNLKGEARIKAIKIAKEVLSADMEVAFAGVELEGFVEALNSLGSQYMNEPEYSEEKKILGERIDEAHKLYDLVVSTLPEFSEDPRFAQIGERLSKIESTFREQGLDAAFKSVVASEKSNKEIGLEGGISNSVLKIIETNEKIAMIEGLEAFKAASAKDEAVFKSMTIQFGLSIVCGVIFGLLWWHYSSRGEDADKKIKELLAKKPQEGRVVEQPEVEGPLLEEILENIEVDVTQQVVIRGDEPPLVGERREASRVEQQPSVSTTGIPNIPKEKPSEPDQIDRYIESARISARGINDPDGMFTWYLAISFVNEIKADPQFKNSSFDAKLTAFLEKLKKMPGVSDTDRNKLQNEFKHAVYLNYLDYLRGTKNNIRSQSDLDKCERIINAAPDSIIPPEEKKQLINIGIQGFNWWLMTQMEDSVANLTKELENYKSVNAYSENNERKLNQEYEAKEIKRLYNLYNLLSINKNNRELLAKVTVLFSSNPNKAINSLGQKLVVELKSLQSK